VPEDTGSTRDDLTAAVGARRELGPDYEDAVLDNFLARLDRQMQERVDATVAERISTGERPVAKAPDQRDPGLTLGIVSVIAGIPVTAITTGTEELAALIVAWGGIAAVNVAHAWGRRRHAS
jgi:VIT1/CCC1 family predicted Fe2+/Mn2+ transporter